MQVRQVQVRGCLPGLVALVIVVALLATAFTAGLALVAVATVVGLVAAIVRRARRLAPGAETATPAERQRAADVTIDAEVIESRGEAERPPKRLE